MRVNVSISGLNGDINGTRLTRRIECVNNISGFKNVRKRYGKKIKNINENVSDQ